MTTEKATNSVGLAIGEVARLTSVPASTLRYYENIGLLPAPHRVSGQRRYDHEVLQRLAVIEFAKHSGFSIAEIGTLFTGFSDALPTPATTHWKDLAKHKIAELDNVISRARAMQQLLEQSLGCECLELEECALIATEQIDLPSEIRVLIELCSPVSDDNG